jgi:single-strand DNA-binding protein
MAAGYNRVIMIGNLTRDPEYKQLASGQAVCRLGLASNRQYRNRQNGEMVQEVCFIDIDVWGAQAESCRQFLEKGRPVLVEGRLKLDQWEDQAKQNRSKHSIVADRIVFLAVAGEVQHEEPMGIQDAGSSPLVQSEMEKGLMAQIKRIKDRESVAQGATKMPQKGAGQPGLSNLSPRSPDIEFKDEPPFQDDLPF